MVEITKVDTFFFCSVYIKNLISHAHLVLIVVISSYYIKATDVKKW